MILVLFEVWSKTDLENSMSPWYNLSVIVMAIIHFFEFVP